MVNKNIEFKREIPKKHEKFLKDVIAFSNCTGGKIILGIEDVTNAVQSIGDANPFNLLDGLSNIIRAVRKAIVNAVTHRLWKAFHKRHYMNQMIESGRCQSDEAMGDQENLLKEL